jgi:hypothetical protein
MIKSAPYYWVECDKCGARCEYGDFSAMSDAGAAVDDAVSDDWTARGEQHHCPSCPAIGDCDNCSKDAGEGLTEREGLCQACWDAAEVKTPA